MRGVDLDLFDFDYDLTWMGFFLDADGRVLGRYGGRDSESPDSRVSLAGLRHAMQGALARHRAGQDSTLPPRKARPRTVADFSAARRLSRSACVHCHQVYDLRRESLQAAGKWRMDEVWVYPLPENVGLTLAVDEGDRVDRVAAGSPAERAGLRKGDRLTAVNGLAVSSFADVQYALHRAPARGKVTLRWQRAGKGHEGQLVLAEGWRKTDVSWRWSLRGLEPAPWVGGDDLTAAEKKALGLVPTRLAFRQSGFVSEPARQAGIRPGDVIIGIDGKQLHLTAQQFSAHVRLGYKVGDRVVYNLLRDGKRVDVMLALRKR
jgi:membrane-associated protease RseP (regulator of RpoE activity)